MGRSKRPPSFGKSAGARLTVMCPAGSSNPQLASAARTRSLLSFTTVSGQPHDRERRQSGAHVDFDAHQGGLEALLAAAQDGRETHRTLSGDLEGISMRAGAARPSTRETAGKPSKVFR
jgi:hypothetical protein